ncbi:MAG: homoserine dehydrogenase [Candidatus Bathyarchaeota archaeon]|uniref:homoserine dehydrogenase n=1 Tax=Candidatus Bathycorpusculum sp. TaxID=2994959 RepID=UPI00282E342D|nr:homoserine dehydrogenase [Candidatus Termiticorpusculum sp.]MCL2257320.1 homoserine dehydrogenase [Candidatus Termiticorpusculum sp.]MCL2292189.1 homoserine dehydrogenase [Candidatus Termiticorpusculum sp.]
MRIILVGYGVVGKGVTTILAKRYTEKIASYGFSPKVVAIADVDGAVINPRGFSPEKLEKFKQKGYPISADPDFGHPSMPVLEVIESVEAEVVVEVTPVNIKNAEPALSYITKAFKTGKHVVTTNKGPLALAMPALTELAEHNNVFLRFSGTVGGGTPMLEFAKRCLAGDKILAIQGILNGTTNYILSEMGQSHISFQEALANAQKLGYAEREPSMDIDGFDTACKTVILSNWIMGKKITLKEVDITGIREVTLEMLQNAAKNRNTIKLLGTIDDNGAIVKPAEVSWTNPLCVSGVLNAVTFQTEYSADQTLIGRGAGGIETANAVLRDLLDIRHKLASKLLS